MKKINQIKNRINELRHHLHNNIDKNSKLSTNELVNISQELDKALVQYYKLLRESNV